jgi:hypothetical protein
LGTKKRSPNLRYGAPRQFVHIVRQRDLGRLQFQFKRVTFGKLNIMKLTRIGVMSGAAIAALSAIALPVSAQEICVRTRHNQIVCGQPVNNPNYGNYGNNGNYRDHDNYGNYGNYGNNGNYGNLRQVARQVNEIFREVLGRDADRAALEGYTRAINGGASLSTIRREVANSAEARTAVDNLYRDILRRPAEEGGLRSWTAYMANGGTLADVRQQIASSPEARGIR